MTKYSTAKTREYLSIFRNFQNCIRCEKDLKDNKHNSLHLGQKYARIFVLGHYLFLIAHSFPRATISENCLLLRTDNVCGQISQHVFAPNGGCCLYIPCLFCTFPSGWKKLNILFMVYVVYIAQCHSSLNTVFLPGFWLVSSASDAGVKTSLLIPRQVQL